MTQLRSISTAAYLVLSATLAFPTLAQDSPEKVKRDLFAVISLQGQSCVKVTDYERRGENDYIAICQTGDRYRVYVGGDGRVAVQKQ
jgi:hypothetical protein